MAISQQLINCLMSAIRNTRKRCSIRQWRCSGVFIVNLEHISHCVFIANFEQVFISKSVRIRSYSGPYFPAFVLNIILRIQPECGKIRTRITPNTDTSYAVRSNPIFSLFYCVYISFTITILWKHYCVKDARTWDFIWSVYNPIRAEYVNMWSFDHFSPSKGIK